MSCSTNKTLGTGSNGCPPLAKAKQFAWTNKDLEFTKAQITDVAYWNTNIRNGNIVLFPEVQEIASQDVEAQYYEATDGTKRVKMEEAKRQVQYSFIESLCTHKGMRSFDGVNGRIIPLTASNEVILTKKTNGKYAGLETSQFNVSPLTTAAGTDPSKTQVSVRQQDVDDLDLRGKAFDVDFFGDLLAPFTVELDEVTGVQAAGTLTVSFMVFDDCGASQITNLAQADFKLTTVNGVAIAIDSVAVDAATGVYTLVATTPVANGVLSLNGVVDKTTILYVSDDNSF